MHKLFTNIHTFPSKCGVGFVLILSGYAMDSSITFLALGLLKSRMAGV